MSTIKFWLVNLETKGYFADQGTGEMLILGWILKKCVTKCELCLSGSSVSSGRMSKVMVVIFQFFK